jgi:salicylate hydroxylase
MNYEKKYLKYKSKFLNLSRSNIFNKIGGNPPKVVSSAAGDEQPEDEQPENEQQGILSDTPPKSRWHEYEINVEHTPKDSDPTNICDIAIVGGGPSGLALAIGLKLKGITCVVFEKDREYDNTKGYSLTIQKNGREVLQALNMLDLIRKHGCAYQETGQHMIHSSGKVLVSPNTVDDGRDNFYIPRAQIRKLLLEEVHRLNIKVIFNTVLKSINDGNSDGNVTLTFSDGSIYKSKIIAGCEGLYSPLREVVIPSSVSPIRYTNVATIWGINKYEHPLACAGSIHVVDGKGTRLFIKPYCTTKKMWLITHTMPEDMVPELSRNPEKAFLKAKECLIGWADNFKEFIETSPMETVRAGKLCDRDPVKYMDMRHPYIVLIGDAAHPMTPFRGQGANSALEDTQLLCNKLILQKGNFREGIQKYYEEMIPKRAELVTQCYNKTQFYHTSSVLDLKACFDFEYKPGKDALFPALEDKADKMTLSLPEKFRTVSTFGENPHTALILIDLLRDFIDPNGFAGLRAKEKGKELLNWGELLKNVKKLVRTARFKGIKIIWVKSEYNPANCVGDKVTSDQLMLKPFPDTIKPLDHFDCRSRRGVQNITATLAGTHCDAMECCWPKSVDRPWGSDFPNDLKPIINLEDIVITKEQFSCFRKLKDDSSLDKKLHDLEINKLIICGLVTNHCVMASCIDAFFLGYNVLIPADCVRASEPNRHCEGLQTLAKYGSVVDRYE